MAQINGAEMRQLRRRMGLTQNDVAYALQVDQGTVSRWERGLEQPRPRTYAALRDLLMRDGAPRAFARHQALIRHNMLPVCLVDARHRLRDFSAQAVDHYRDRIGIALPEHRGWDLARHAAHVGNPEVWRAVSEAGLGREDILLLRMTITVRGNGHVTHIEPIYEAGDFLGWCSIRTGVFETDDMSTIALQRLEAIYADEPQDIVPVFDRQETPLRAHP
jgi:transcriptional regulator with XRE-family HTH domain